MAEHFWIVRVPRGEEYVQMAKDKSVIAVGFAIKQSVKGVTDRDAMKELYRKEVPNASPGRVIVASGQLYRLAHVVKPGDWVLTPDRYSRTLMFGKVEGDYVFQQDVLGPGFSHARRVKWMGDFGRDEMSPPLKYSAGGIMTIQTVDKFASELLRLMKQKPSSVEPTRDDGDVGTETPYHEEVRAKADELIGDLISRIDPMDLQELVAGLLEAMGYRTRVGPSGRDQGVDVLAYPDALGFQSPRIKVQVKHRQNPAGGPDIRNLVGALNADERGLFVSTGGFSKDARTEAGKNSRITLVDADELVLLLTEHYDKLDPDYKAMVPLRRIWVPVKE